MEKQNTKLKGFTLVELLVVISIIAVLLSVLMPALSKARNNAKRVMCSSNLHQWGVVIGLYASDNNGRLMGTVQMWTTTPPYPPYPSAAWLSDSSEFAKRYSAGGQFSANLVGKYIPEFKYDSNNPAATKLGDIWNCPANKFPTGDLLNYNAQAGFFTVQYSYFARTDLWPLFKTTYKGASHPQQLTERQLKGDRIIMADTCYIWGNSSGLGTWNYNHGKNGSSSQYGTKVYKDDGSVGGPKVLGLNDLYGDGHVKWKPSGKGEGKLDPIGLKMATQPRVRGDKNDFSYY